MCSILGMVSYGAPNEWKHAVVRELFRQAEARGTHASGLAYIKNGHTQVVKVPVRGSEFANSDELREVLEGDNPEILIGHTRNKTQGHESVAYNNHPQVSKRTGIAIVHNGSVRDALWRTKDDGGSNPFILDEFEAEVDSEAILRLIDTLLFIPRGKDGKIYEDVVAKTPKDKWPTDRQIPTLQAIDEATYNLSGGNTCALVDPADPNALYVWAVKNPLYIAIVPEYKTVVFASLESMVKAALEMCEWETYGDSFFYRKIDVETIDFIGRQFPENTAIRLEFTDSEEIFSVQEVKLDPDGADFTKSVVSGTTFKADEKAVTLAK